MTLLIAERQKLKRKTNAAQILNTYTTVHTTMVDLCNLLSCNLQTKRKEKYYLCKTLERNLLKLISFLSFYYSSKCHNWPTVYLIETIMVKQGKKKDDHDSII